MVGAARFELTTTCTPRGRLPRAMERNGAQPSAKSAVFGKGATTSTRNGTQRNAESRNQFSTPVPRNLPSPSRPANQLRLVVGGRKSLLSVRDVADQLSISTATVYAIVERGELPHIRVSNAVRVAPTDLDAYIASQRRGTP